MTLKFIDLFAGIGGFHLALHELGAECVFASEINHHARKTYERNFKDISPELFEQKLFNDDILKIAPENIPGHDILCAGFPCQPFSQAGFKKGFNDENDSRGNMFFIIRDIIKAKRPKAIFLENVRHLKNHEDGRTFDIIREVIEQNLGYSFYYKIVKASDHGLPQHRPRIFIVGFRNDIDSGNFSFPEKEELKTTMTDIFGMPCDKDIGYTLRVGGRASGIGDRRNWDTYIAGDKVIKISSKEGKKMMGYPDNFIFPVSETEAMKQLGNSVAVPAIKATACKIIDHLNQITKSKVREPYIYSDKETVYEAYR